MGGEFRLNERFGCGWIGDAGAGVKGNCAGCAICVAQKTRDSAMMVSCYRIAGFFAAVLRKSTLKNREKAATTVDEGLQFTPARLEEVFGSLHYSGAAKTIEEMHAAVLAEAKRQHTADKSAGETPSP